MGCNLTSSEFTCWVYDPIQACNLIRCIQSSLNLKKTTTLCQTGRIGLNKRKLHSNALTVVLGITGTHQHALFKLIHMAKSVVLIPCRTSISPRIS